LVAGDWLLWEEDIKEQRMKNGRESNNWQPTTDNELPTPMNNTFKALNDRTRREILELLHRKDMTAGEIADSFNISKPSISHHLDILKQAGLVESSRDGQFITYSLNMTVMDELMTWLIKFQTGKKNKNGNSTKHTTGKKQK
jgi:ArsR family transcriptional regulator, arsenate/arsenite/antimonite-responsive transcriptional repressor